MGLQRLPWERPLVRWGAGALVLVIVAAAWWSGRGPANGPSEGALPGAGLEAAEPAVSPGVPSKLQRLALEWGRDPFSEVSAGGGTETPRRRLTVDGILWDPVRPMALVDGRIVGLGEVVGGRRVIAIREDRLILEDLDGRQSTWYVGGR